ncbi:MAG: SUMF1/EgtB/PvdO family nonheme iron enzyme [Oculatellaceae cyanobacterium Prado106]|nr:SUMF1/EgtB/PvdO family nonheme iron enzyme [Oculatellaceae cyanobacterium Prado106]
MERSPTPSPLESPIKVFISYSRKDQDLRDKLETYLSPLVRLGKITIWHDRKIPGGAEWKEEIDHHIQTAEIILLLISTNFTHSKFCYETELPIAMARHDAEDAKVLPILLSSVPFWQELPFAKLQIYPSNSKPISEWDREAHAFGDIVLGIGAIVNDLFAARQQHQQELNNWLAQIPLPLSADDQPELARRQKLAKINDTEVSEKISEILALRQEQVRLEEQKRQEQERQRQAEQSRKEQKRLRAEQKRREQAEQERLRKQRLQEAIQRLQPIAIHTIKRTDPKLVRSNRVPIEFVPISGSKLWMRSLDDDGDDANHISIEFVPIPSGKFWMGSLDSEGDTDEKPRHEVTITSFYMSKFPITQTQYQIVMEQSPSIFKGGNRPVENVSWNDAIAFCEALSKLSDCQITLPSEAQWEYACRAGTETSYYFGETLSTDQANYREDDVYVSSHKAIYRRETTDVGNFPPNPFDLHDMHGNVWEWCADHWHGNYRGAPTDGRAWIESGDSDFRLLRGGSWLDYASQCRSAYRGRNFPDLRNGIIGFRVVLLTVRT